ncbi:MAG: hypothetical protein HND47_12150 [Chloroflexi bacterium]|nr:hypothetical protein [Chloroflexota bacterium]
MRCRIWVSYEHFADELIVTTCLTWPSEDQSFVEDILRGVIEHLVIYLRLGQEFGQKEEEAC